MSFEEKYYQAPLIELISIQEDVITASTGKDPFDDGYEDPNFTPGT